MNRARIDANEKFPKNFVSRVGLLAAAFVLSVVTASPAHAVTFDWASVGDIDNAPDTHGDGYGAVGYKYRISTTEVTNTQYVEFLNAVAATDTFALYNTDMGSTSFGGITRDGSPGSYTYAVKSDAVGKGPGGLSDYEYGNKPVVYVSWWDALRFANWLTSGTTESGTYAITDGGEDSGTVTLPDHSTLEVGKFFLPTENEWYKAAYYNGSVYFDYATGTDTPPNNNLPTSDTGNSINFKDSDFATGDADYPMTDVGDYGLSASPYGTFDQGGNVWEWNETVIASSRGIRGSSWVFGAYFTTADFRNNANPWNEISSAGFRVGSPFVESVPEPGTAVLGVLGGLLLMLLSGRRLRRRIL